MTFDQIFNSPALAALSPAARRVVARNGAEAADVTFVAVNLPKSTRFWHAVADVIIAPSFPDPTDPMTEIVDSFIEAGYDDETAENLAVWYVR